MDSKKGFITIATGKESYYKMAHNLLLSYRYHAATEAPFAIICDRVNEWTADFDKVVIIDDPSCSFFDKIRILDLCPFEETIFVDADCLAYRDLNDLWELFINSPDVGVLGETFPLDSGNGWWDQEILGDLKDLVDFKMDCQGGIYYVRKGKQLSAFKDTCNYVLNHFDKNDFRLYTDETIIALASSLHHFSPVQRWVEVFAYMPEAKFYAIDIHSGFLEYEWTRFPGPHYKNKYLIHFTTFHALNRWLYKREVFKLKRGPVDLSNFGDYLLLRFNHARHKLVMTFYRFFCNKRKYTMEIYA